MIRRIELVNFMSHARTVIEPADGLTVLVGPNNCGKSAVVAALQILCHNDNSTYVTRHNERECTVTVETSDGHTVQWSRKNSSPRYSVNGQPFDRLDRNSVPEGLHQILCLPKVTADGNREFDVHFGEQKSPVFLLDKPGSHAAQFFASSSDAASLVEMQKLHQQKMVEARKERSRLNADAERLARDLSILSAADPISASIEGAQADHTALAQLSSAISQGTDDTRILGQAIGTLERREADVCVLAPLRAPPQLEPTDPLAQVISQLAQTAEDVQRQAALAASLVRLRAAPDLADEQPLTRLVDDLCSAERSSRRLGAACLAAKKLQPPPQMEDVQALHGVVHDVVAFGQKAANMQDRAAAIGALAAPPQLVSESGLSDDLRSLERGIATLERAGAIYHRLVILAPPAELPDPTDMTVLVAEIEQVQRTIGTHEQNVTQTDKQLEHAEQDLRRWAEDNRICPTCGGTLDPARVAEHARTHMGGGLHA